MSTHNPPDTTVEYVRTVAPAPYRSPRYIPTIENSVSGPDCPIKNAYFCWLNSADQERYALDLMGDGCRPSFKLVRADTVDKTKELARALWRSPHAEHFVDTAKNCIRIGVDVLAYRDLQEYLNWRARQIQDEDARRGATVEEFETRIDALGVKGIKPVIMPVAEVRDRAKHAEREGRPMVGSSGAARAAGGST